VQHNKKKEDTFGHPSAVSFYDQPAEQKAQQIILGAALTPVQMQGSDCGTSKAQPNPFMAN